MANMRVLVVFYSRKGTTKKIAELISTKLNCDIEQIIDKKNRTKFLTGFLTSGRDATREILTTISIIQKNPELYDLVILGTPIWNQRMSPALRTYIIENKAKFNNVAFFCTHFERVGMGNTFDKIAELSEKTPILTLEITKRDIKKGYHFEKIENFVQKIKIEKFSTLINYSII